MGLISELRRRNVHRMAALYAIAAWLIMQMVEVLMTLVELPEWAGRATLGVLAVGFPIAVAFSWFYELTPEGVKLEKDIDPTESTTHVTGRRLNFLVISLLAAAVIVFAYDKWWMHRPPEQSIAVLPFVNMSDDPGNEYFSDGMSEEILNKLARIPGLKVIGRTSSFAFKGKNEDLRVIGQTLGVKTVLEGSVRQSGDRVRITAQLIDVSDGAHIWSETYNRTMTDIFAVQDDVAAAIIDALQMHVGTNPTRERPTENIAAYNLYIQGRANLYKRRLVTLLQAREQFEQASELDPDYAEAYVGLADTLLLLFNNHAAISREEMLTVVEPALDKALSLGPDLADAYASLGLLKHQIWGETRTGPELEEAEAAYLRAIELNPNHPRAYMWFAQVRTDQQRFDEAIELYHQALRVDPLGRIPYSNLPGLYAQMNRNDDALDLYVKAVHIHPEWPTAYLNLSQHLQGLGRLDEAIAWGMRGQELSTDPLAGAFLIASYVEFGDYDQARKIPADIPVDHPLYELGDGIDSMLDRDFAAAAASFEDIVTSSDNPRQFMFGLIAVCAVLAGDYEKARQYTERRNPDFAADANPQVDRFNIASIIQYAFILQNQGEKRRAESLLARALPVVHSLPRIGLAGHGIRDVQILALQGKSFEALTALREAIDEGFRGTTYSNGWPLSLDPYLDSIRDRPEYQAMASEIDDAVILMQERVAEAEASDNWDDLRALATST
jgi:TolB-like protein